MDLSSVLGLIQTALELGLICSVTVLALYLSDTLLIVCGLARVYPKTPNAPGQRAFSRCTAPFFLEIRQYSCEKSLAQRKNSSLPVPLGVGRIHPRTSKREKSRDLERCDEKAGQSRGVVCVPRRSHLPAVRAVSGIYEGVVERAKIAPVGS